MTPVSRKILLKIHKLASLPEEIRQSPFVVSITRLTSLKSLCREPDRATRFVTCLARKTLENMKREKETPSHTDTPNHGSNRRMMQEALEGMEAWQKNPSETLRQTLSDLLGKMRAVQNKHRKSAWVLVRLIVDGERPFLRACG